MQFIASLVAAFAAVLAVADAQSCGASFPSSYTGPATFDLRSGATGSCLGILNQNQCGSCYVHSAVSSFSARYCLYNQQSASSVPGFSMNLGSSQSSPAGTFLQISTQFVMNYLATGNNYSTSGPNWATPTLGVCNGGFPGDVLQFLSYVRALAQSTHAHTDSATGGSRAALQRAHIDFCIHHSIVVSRVRRNLLQRLPSVRIRFMQ